MQCIDFLVAPVEFLALKRIEAARGSFFHFNVITRDIESAPKGIRTPVLALRGPRPGPLDDGGLKRRHSTISSYNS